MGPPVTAGFSVVAVEGAGVVVPGVHQQGWGSHGFTQQERASRVASRSSPQPVRVVPVLIDGQGGREETGHRLGGAFGDRFAGGPAFVAGHGDRVVADDAITAGRGDVYESRCWPACSMWRTCAAIRRARRHLTSKVVRSWALSACGACWACPYDPQSGVGASLARRTGSPRRRRRSSLGIGVNGASRRFWNWAHCHSPRRTTCVGQDPSALSSALPRMKSVMVLVGGLGGAPDHPQLGGALPER